MPCSDTHQLFKISSNISEDKPVTMKTMMKALYNMNKLKLEQFSTPHPAFANNTINFIVNSYGRVSGWNKLVTKIQR